VGATFKLSDLSVQLVPKLPPTEGVYDHSFHSRIEDGRGGEGDDVAVPIPHLRRLVLVFIRYLALLLLPQFTVLACGLFLPPSRLNSEMG